MVVSLDEFTGVTKTNGVVLSFEAIADIVVLSECGAEVVAPATVVVEAPAAVVVVVALAAVVVAPATVVVAAVVLSSFFSSSLKA